MSPPEIRSLVRNAGLPGAKGKPFKKVSFFPQTPFILPNWVVRSPALFPDKMEKAADSYNAVLDRKRGLGEAALPKAKLVAARLATAQIVDLRRATGKRATFSKKVALCPQKLQLPATLRDA